MADAKILYHQHENRCIFKFVGEIRHTLCSGLDAALKKALGNKKLTIFIVDLTSTTYLDSTSLGLIAKIARHTFTHKYPKPIIFSSNQNVNIILQSMGFDDIFTILEHVQEESNEFDPVVQHEISNKQTHDIILEAHKILMDLNDQNKQAFKNVVELLNTSSE